MVSSAVEPIGASPAAIRSHYDVSNEFFAAWLDPTMTYSCAMWSPGDDTLESAQHRKLDYHIERARVASTDRVLDIGCGWGSALRRMTGSHGVKKAVGLTLSMEQAAWINGVRDPRVDVLVQSWADHVARVPYDGILCLGALEHFARPEDTRQRRVEAYRAFFARCRELLVPGGWLSLQTIAFGIGKYVPGSPLAEIFPESHLPRLSEIAEGFDRIFDLDVVRNDRQDYVKTLNAWIQGLEANWDVAVRATGPEMAERYRRYLQFTMMGFAAGYFDLLRISLKSIPMRKSST
jgi:cyclopropane-fatty-acyl-phospholipid synthase